MENTITPICRTCHTQIGHIYPIYKTILINRIKEYNDKHDYDINDFAAVESIRMSDIFEICNINNPCCRGQIMGFSTSYTAP